MRPLILVALAALATMPVWAAEIPTADQAGADNQIQRVTLDQAIAYALQNNPDILEAKQEIERTRGLVIEVRAQALPQVVSTATYSQQDPNLLEGSSFNGGTSSQQQQQQSQDTSSSGGTTGNGTTGSNQDTSQQSQSATDQNAQGGTFGVQDKSWRVSIEARQVIYAGGQVRSALSIAKFEEDSSYYSLLDTVNNVIADVRKGFYQILLNKALITVQQESVYLLGKELENQRNRFEAGTVTRFEVLRAEVSLANQKPELIRARNAYHISKLRLAKLMGAGGYLGRSDATSSPIDAEGKLVVTRRPIDLKQALEVSVARRAFLKVQRQQILIEKEQIKLALSGYKPRIDVNGGYELRNSRLSEDLDETVNGWFFGVTGRWAIFDGLETYGKVKQAKARLESAKVNYDDSVRQVQLEVQEAYSRVREARELLQSQTKNVEQALEALRLAYERANAGAATQLDVLDARTALTQARTTELQARFDYNSAMADFEKATGEATSYADTFDDPLIRKLRKRAARDDASR